jgi:hypothetical protein
MTDPDYDVALSFAGEDRPYVAKVASLLRDRGVRVFYDEYEKVTLWGKDLYTHLGDVYGKKARYTVMFISEHYRKKLWTNHERMQAQARAFEESREYILPARFDDTDVPGLTSTIGYIDLRVTTPEDFAEMVAQKVLGDNGRQTAQARLTNSELKNKAVELVRKMRLSLTQHRAAQDRLLYADRATAAATEDQRSSAWNKRNEEMSALSRTLMTEYSGRFKARAILYKEELVMRLPPSNRDKSKDFTYEHPTNPLGYEEVVDDLEMLARRLPT